MRTAAGLLLVFVVPILVLVMDRAGGPVLAVVLGSLALAALLVSGDLWRGGGWGPGPPRARRAAAVLLGLVAVALAALTVLLWSDAKAGDPDEHVCGTNRFGVQQAC